MEGSITLQQLCEMDAYSVLPPQPLGDYLKSIVDMLRGHERSLKENQEANQILQLQIQALGDQQKALGDQQKTTADQQQETNTRLEALDARQKVMEDWQKDALFDSLNTKQELAKQQEALEALEQNTATVADLEQNRVQLEDLRNSVEQFKEKQLQDAAAQVEERDRRFEDMDQQLKELERQLRELQGVRFGPEFSRDARLLAIETDLCRPDTSERQSLPISVRLAMPHQDFMRAGEKEFRESVAFKAGLSLQDVQILEHRTDDTAPGTTAATFRFNFPVGRREKAEGVAESVVRRLQAGKNQIMEVDVLDCWRPNPQMVGLEAPARRGYARHRIGKTVAGLVNAMAASMGRIAQNEFWMHRARGYFERLRAYRRPAPRWKGKEGMCLTLLSNNKRVLLAEYFRKLRRFVPFSKLQKRRVRAVKYLMANSANGVRRVYHHKALDWLRELEAARKQQQEAEMKRVRRQRALKYLMANTANGIRRVYHAKAMEWLRLRRASGVRRGHKGQGVADNLLLATNRGVRSRVWKILLRHAQWKRSRRNLIVQLSGKNKNVLRLRYLEKWKRFVKARRRMASKRLAVDALSVNNLNLLRLKYYLKWRRFLHLVQQHQKHLRKRRLQGKLATELRGKTMKGRLRDGFAALRNHAQQHRKGREKEMMDRVMSYLSQDGKYDELSRRCDTLGTQVDVGLKTLTNTNSVLNKLVDRLISVDEQLDHLDKEKVSKKDLQQQQQQQVQSQPRPPTPPAPALPPQQQQQQQQSQPQPQPQPQQQLPPPQPQQRTSQPQPAPSHLHPTLHVRDPQPSPTAHAQPKPHYHPSDTAMVRGVPQMERRDVSPPRKREDHSPSNASLRDKEAEQWRLLQLEKQKLKELQWQDDQERHRHGPPPEADKDRLQHHRLMGGTWPHDVSPIREYIPSAEDTLQRARQWQRDRGAHPNISPAPPSVQRAQEAGWRIT